MQSAPVVLLYGHRDRSERQSSFVTSLPAERTATNQAVSPFGPEGGYLSSQSRSDYTLRGYAAGVQLLSKFCPSNETQAGKYCPSTSSTSVGMQASRRLSSRPIF